MVEFQHVFEVCSSPLPHLAEDVLENTFLKGFCPTLKVEVINMLVVCARECYETCLVIEDRDLPVKLALEDLRSTSLTSGVGQSAAE